MKKILILVCLCGMVFLSACNKTTLSNLDVQKLNQKAAVYMQNGEYDKAAARLESIIDLNPDFYEAYYNLGIAYYQMGEYDKALNALNNAISKNNKFPDSYYSRAVVQEDWAYANKDDLEGKEVKILDEKKSQEYVNNAISDYEKYIELNPNASDKDDVLKKINELKEKQDNALED